VKQFMEVHNPASPEATTVEFSEETDPASF